MRRYYGRVVTLTKDERFKLFDWEEVFYIADTLKSKKTLEDFKNELMIEWKEELAIGETDEESIEEMANEKYQEYLYENSLDGKEIVDKLNYLDAENRNIKKTYFYQNDIIAKQGLKIRKLEELLEIQKWKGDM